MEYTRKEQAIIDAQLDGRLPMFLTSRAALEAYDAIMDVLWSEGLE